MTSEPVGTADAGEFFFDLDTALGRAYAGVDWNASPVGDPSTWPDSLRTVFRLMCASRFAIWVGWGDDLAFFCNDAYRLDTLGAKFPWALGRPTRVVWSEIWDEIVPLTESVLVGGEASYFDAMLLFLERNGYPEETYHTFSYSPLYGDEGEVAGLFCVVSEDTGRVVTQRRITLLRDLAGALTDARDETDVLDTVARETAAAAQDLPFLAAYLLESGPDDSAASSGVARLAFTGGIPAGHPAAPSVVDVATVIDGVGAAIDGVGSAAGWTPFWPADGASRVVDDLGARFGELPTGAWERPPTQGLTVALSQPGDEGPIGFLAVGLNPHRPLDADYIGFVELVAGQLTSALMRARGYEAERLRAEQILELDRAKTTFFTNVSHELRTPLTLLLGPAEDALADTAHALAPTQRGRVEVIVRNAERLSKLVNTLLDFSRLESGRTQGRFEAIDLAALTAELASMFELAMRRAGLDFEVDCPPLPGPVVVDREMWAKIVLNLLSNALKATFTGSVSVRLEAVPDGAALSVTDTGVGIEPAEQGRLFERFHRVSGVELRTHEGSGIGLALVAELAALNGGTVAVRSTPGSGSTFTVTVPTGATQPSVAPSLDPPVERRSLTRSGAGYLAEALRWLDAEDTSGPTASPGPGDEARRVLVVDDNADMRQYVSGVLSENYRVTTAADGAAALDLARADPPDLVLTDVMMPVLDGFGLLAALRADPLTMHIPVVMLSARSGDDAAVEGLEAGADDYLVKPFAQRELLARVRANLELDRVRRVAQELERSRAMLAYAEEIALVGSFDYDIAADRLSGTPQFYALLGAPVGVGCNSMAEFVALVHPDDRRTVEVAVALSMTTGEPFGLEFRVGERLLWLRATVDQQADGTSWRVRGSAQDVTDQRRAELDERAAAAARIVAERESAIARELQNSLLPADTFDADHLDIAGYYRAGVEGTQVGGDWYDVISLDAGRTALVLGDVMGRGIQAAAVMGQLRASVRAYSRLELAPDTVLHLLDDAVREMSADKIVTCVYAIYDPSEHTLTYANAGHLPPLLAVPGQPVVRLTAGGPPLGAGRSWGRPQTIELPTGAIFAMFTDGLVEQRGVDLDEGIDHVARLLAEPVADITDLPGRLTSALITAGHDDDVAVLVARVSDRSTADRVAARPVDSDVAVVGAARDWVLATLTEWQVPAGLVDDARLIVSELVTNAIVHGQPPVELRLRLAGHRVLIEVLDAAVTTPQLQHAKPTDDHGRGLLIVSMLAQRWGTRPTPHGKSVWCQLPLS